MSDVVYIPQLVLLVHIHSSYMTLIGVHEMHGRMHPLATRLSEFYKATPFPYLDARQHPRQHPKMHILVVKYTYISRPEQLHSGGRATAVSS